MKLAVQFTQLQLEEIVHKLQIVADEPDLQESYEISPEDAQALADHFGSCAPGIVTFDEAHRDLVAGEIQDRMNALHSNWKDCGDESEGGAYRSMAQALKRVQEAKPDER